MGIARTASRILPAALLLAAAVPASAWAQAPRGFTSYAYAFRCADEQVFERYLTTRTIDEAVARMFWLDRGACRVLRFTREGDPRNLWPGIRACLAEREAADRAVAAGGDRVEDLCRFDAR